LPLTQLTRKNKPWLWSVLCQISFEALKRAFTSAPTLVHWDPDSPMIVETDISDHALVAILSTQVNGIIYPIAFHSQVFLSVKSRSLRRTWARFQIYYEGERDDEME